MLDPEERRFHVDWESATAEFVGSFRQSIGDVTDASIVELVGELSLASARFRALWARHDIRPLAGGTTKVDHPIVGELHLHRDKLPVGELILVLYYADNDSDSAEKLSLLASWATPTAEEESPQSHLSAPVSEPDPRREHRRNT